MYAEVPQRKRDHKGYKGAERMAVPSTLFCGIGVDRTYNRKSHFEEKGVTKRNKDSLKASDEAQIRSEMMKGFNKESP
eukprot:12961672-Alexandrium_andersonii.AAC.1